MGELPVSNEQALILQALIDQALADLANLDAKAQRVREQLADQLARIDEEATQLRIFVSVLRKYVNAGLEQQTDGPAPPTAPTSDTADARPKYRRIMDMAVDLIRTAGRPVPTGELLAQMEQRGLDVGGKSHASTLSSYLSRDEKQQVTSSKLGWKLVEWGDDPPPNVRPKRQRRPRNGRQTRKAAQDQQGGTAT